MTEERLVLAELLEKAAEGDFPRAVAEAVLQILMEADVEGLIGAGRRRRGDRGRAALPRRSGRRPVFEAVRRAGSASAPTRQPGRDNAPPCLR